MRYINKRKKLDLTSQSGITLLIAILVLAVVSMISFSIGTLVLRELKASRRFAQSEPAIVSAEAGGESAVFFRIRGLNSHTQICPTTGSGTLPAGYSYEYCSELYDDPLYFGTSSDDVKVVLIVNPLDSTSFAAGYSSLSITATSGTAVSLTAKAYDLEGSQVDEDECEDNNNPICVTVPVNGSPTTLSGLDPNKSYAVFLDPGGINRTASGSVDGTTSGGINGIPSETPAVQSTGENEGLRRKIEIRLR